MVLQEWEKSIAFRKRLFVRKGKLFHDAKSSGVMADMEKSLREVRQI